MAIAGVFHFQPSEIKSMKLDEFEWWYERTKEWLEMMTPKRR